MNKTSNQNPNQSHQVNNNKGRAENKDNLDSREGEEQLTKGNDTKHNKKGAKSAKATTKSKRNS